MVDVGCVVQPVVNVAVKLPFVSAVTGAPLMFTAGTSISIFVALVPLRVILNGADIPDNESSHSTICINVSVALKPLHLLLTAASDE
jgi:hypothetical protein